MGILARKSIAEPEQAGDLEESFFETKPSDDIMGEISFNMLTKNTAFQKETAISPEPIPSPEILASPKRDQALQASDFDSPDLNLSAYLEQNSNNKSVDIALQVGDSIRETND